MQSRDEAMRAAADAIDPLPFQSKWGERTATAGADAELARVIEWMASRERVELNRDGSIDEVVTTGGLHLEHMGGKRWFLGCTRVDGTSIAIWFEGKITMTQERPAHQWTLAAHAHWKDEQ